MGGTAIARRSYRAWYILAGVVVFFAVAAIVALKVVYPRVAAAKLRSTLHSKISQRLGREATIGEITVKVGHAVIRNVVVAGPNDGAAPLLKINRIDVNFDGAKSLLGTIVLGSVIVDGVSIAARRDSNGLDNFADIVTRVRTPRPETAGAARSARPTSIVLKHIHGEAMDERTGAHLAFADAEAMWTPAEVHGTAHDVAGMAPTGQTFGAQMLTMQRLPGHAPTLQVTGGALELWPKMELAGIAGTIAADEVEAGRVRLDLSGGYGDVATTLWTARGWVDPRAATGVVDLSAAKFRLDQLKRFLANAKLVDYEKTTLDATVHLELQRDGATFAGKVHVANLSVGHPMLADREVHGLGVDGMIAGTLSRSQRRLELTQGEFVSRGLPVQITGVLELAGGKLADGGTRVARVVTGHFVIPPVNCQDVLAAIPAEMAPYLAGYQLKGTFATDLKLVINWANLDATTLGGSVGIRNCKVTQRPSDSPARLNQDFEHYVEVEKGEWISFDVGPDNPEFVPLLDISPYVMKSIMSTEDSAFEKHHGFIPSEFRTALINNLKAGGFRYGASSITMQMVKNVLLYRKKTLARKLQELYLTWDVENVLSKARIMEIYLNVIEYGPGLYGIGPAAQHYFGKPAKDLTPTEAAFFSSILPAPKQRYKQYCEGTLTHWTEGKIARILNIMLKRKRLTQEEYDAAVATPLVFAKDGSETPEECLHRQARAVKNSRSTNPQEK